jgi:hypothetical protein
VPVRFGWGGETAEPEAATAEEGLAELEKLGLSEDLLLRKRHRRTDRLSVGNSDIGKTRCAL